jgi:hypothetical protein
MGWLAALPLGKRPDTHCTGAWVGPKTGLYEPENFAATGIWYPDRPSRSKSLYRLSYPVPMEQLVAFRMQRCKNTRGKCVNVLSDSTYPVFFSVDWTLSAQQDVAWQEQHESWLCLGLPCYRQWCTASGFASACHRRDANQLEQYWRKWKTNGDRLCSFFSSCTLKCTGSWCCDEQHVTRRDVIMVRKAVLQHSVSQSPNVCLYLRLVFRLTSVSVKDE